VNVKALVSCLLTLVSIVPVIAGPSTRLPTGQILDPIGSFISIDGTMASNLVRIPHHPWVAVICSGARQSVSIVDINAKRVLSEISFQKVNASNTNYVPIGDAYYGLAVDPTGTTLYVSRGGEDRVASYQIGDDGSLRDGPVITEAPPSTGAINFVAGVAVDAKDAAVYAANNMSDTVAAISISNAVTGSTLQTPVGALSSNEVVYPVGSYPLAIVVDDTVGKVYVTSERDSSISVIRTGSGSTTISKTIEVGSHPDALLVSASGGRLFVANGDSDTISIVDTKLDSVQQTIPLRPSSVSGLPGATPTGLCLSPDQRTLYVTLADMNAVAVVKLDRDLLDGQVIGYFPTGWYPAALTLNAAGTAVIVANAKGSTPVVPNPLGPNPISKYKLQYIHDILPSTLSIIPIPSNENLRGLTREVLADNAISRPIDADSHAITSLLSSLPIKHVIYIIKENRTYDEVLGDLPLANGDPHLVLFGQTITPNLHALSTEFVTLDNFYCCAEVSADGWNWSTSGFANEYVQRSVPESYSESNLTPRKEVRSYDYEGENRDLAVSDRGIADVAQSPGGYIWDAVKGAGLSYRDYGAFISGDGDRPAKPALLLHTDYDFSPFDVNYADSDGYGKFDLPFAGKSVFGPDKLPSRYSAWKSEFDQYVQNGQLPDFELVRFMRDHTAGTTPGTNSPQAMAADNDYAVGELVDDVSHSRYWKNTAIFVVEDDAQNGPDHVDCHRSTCYVISPFITRHLVDHRFYNTDSVLRSIELLLHAPAMTRLDSSAHPIGAFTTVPNFSPFRATRPDLNVLAEVNKDDSVGSALSHAMNFAIADDAPEDALNNIIWQSIKGSGSIMPAPRHAALGD
jgi:YVTN family beta-propeller protein